ncbi:MAG: hypothetical protein C5B43_02900 [Verrucomicrobia bacterium]|nr:MAG: hypothetical protein C5B43_02900 [Verrucomicrobiota bacterium]
MYTPKKQKVLRLFSIIIFLALMSIQSFAQTLTLKNNTTSYYITLKNIKSFYIWDVYTYSFAIVPPGKDASDTWTASTLAGGSWADLYVSKSSNPDSFKKFKLFQFEKGFSDWKPFEAEDLAEKKEKTDAFKVSVNFSDLQNSIIGGRYYEKVEVIVTTQPQDAH